MKKIIFFAYNLNIGGIEKSLVNLLNNLVDKYNIILVLEKNEGMYKKDLSKKVKIIEYKISTIKIVPIRKIINFANRSIFKIKNKNKYDFSCAYATYLPSANMLAKICSKNRVIYVHNDYNNTYSKNEYLEFFNTRGIEKYKKIIFVSNESKDNFIKYYPNLKDKTLVINNILNIKEIITKSEEKLDIKKSKGEKIFSFVGRLDEHQKRISRLLKTFKILVQKDKNIKLWIIGDGEHNEKAKKYIATNKLEKNITLFGRQDNPYKYIKNSDYLILTSDYEGFPVVFNEANILGKLVFSTLNISDDYYNLTNGYGILIPKEEKLMASKIFDTIKSEPKVKQINYEKLNEERINKIINIIENEEV